MGEIWLPTERILGNWTTHLSAPWDLIAWVFMIDGLKVYFLSYKLACVSGFSAPLEYTITFGPVCNKRILVLLSMRS